MTSPHSTMTEVQGQLKYLTGCDICWKALQNPRMLPCLHIVCLRCISQAGEELNRRPEEIMPCPACRKEFTIPTNGFYGLKKNLFIERMIEKLHFLERSRGQIPCDACTDETANESIAIAASYCLECNLNLCQQCSAHHGRSRLTKEHRLAEGANLTNARESEEAPDSRMCLNHTDEEMKLYCKNCSFVLCPMCFIESHQGHERLSLVEAGDDFRSQIEDSINSIDICISKAIMKKELLEREIDKRTTQLEEEIMKRRDDLKELIDDHARLLLEQLQTKSRKKREAVTERDDNKIHFLSLESFKKYSSKFVEFATNGEICRATSDLKAKATDLCKDNDATVQRPIGVSQLLFNATKLDKFSTLVENIIGTIEDPENEEPEELTTEESDIDENTDTTNATSQSDPENEEPEELTAEESDIDENTNTTNATSQSASTENLLCPSEESAEDSEMAMPQQEQPAAGMKKSVKNSLLVQTLTTDIAKKESRTIWGVTSLNNKLYIVRKGSSVVEVYDLMSLRLTRKWNFEKLRNPQDITSCTKNNCLYVMDWNLAMIFRLSSNKSLLYEWSVPDGGGRLSVTHESNVLFTAYRKSKLCEYRADGHPVCDIKLSSADGILHPQHAVKLSNGGFVVSHGAIGDPLHRVCIVDGSGKMLKSIGGKPGWSVGRMNIPLHLAVKSDGSILVADWSNGRVLLLSSQLKFNKELLSRRDGLRHPGRICFNETNGQLIVADNLNGWSDGQVLIYRCDI